MNQSMIAAVCLPNPDNQVWSLLIPTILGNKEVSAGDASIEVMIEQGEE